MTTEEFNEKYKDFLEEGHYGLDLHKPEAIEYLDKEFQEFIKIPGFSYSQIKGKFNWFCFYNEGISREKTIEVEQKLKEIMFHEGHQEYFHEDIVDGKLITVWLGKDYIPKDEPIQKTGKEFYESADKIITVKKQETVELEEAAKKYSSISFNKQDLYDGFIEGAKWQAKKMYSEEEVKQIIETKILQAKIEENKSVLRMLKLHGNARNRLPVLMRVNELEEQLKQLENER